MQRLEASRISRWRGDNCFRRIKVTFTLRFRAREHRLPAGLQDRLLQSEQYADCWVQHLVLGALLVKMQKLELRADELSDRLTMHEQERQNADFSY